MQQPFSERLTAAMNDKGLTAEDLTRELKNRTFDVKLGTVRKWMNGSFGTPTNDKLVSTIEEICECTLVSARAKRGQPETLAELAAA